MRCISGSKVPGLISLEVLAKLWFDASVSWSRLFLALFASLFFSWIVGITAAKSQTGEKIILPLLDILQSIPILGFFPIILVVFLAFFPQQVGVYLAVTFLIFTSMTWNITFAVYESVKSIPKELCELANLEGFGLYRRIMNLYIPASWPKVAYNTMVSWSVALFYLVASEIFSLGNKSYQVEFGIGVDVAKYGASQQWDLYIASLSVIVGMLLITYLLFLNEFSHWTEKFKLGYDAPNRDRRSPVHKFYSWIHLQINSKLGLPSKLLQSRISNSRAYLMLARTDSNNFRAERTQSAAMRRIEVVIFCAALTIMIGSFLYLNRNYSGTVYYDLSLIFPAFVASLGRIWLVYAVAAAVSLPFGIFVASHQKAFEWLTPLLQLTAAVPAPALLPAIALATMSLPEGGEANAFIVIFLGMIWYLIFNIIEGVRSIPRPIFNVSKLLNLKGLPYWRNVLIPAILPSFITGSITAIGGGWNTLIIAEYFRVSTESNGGPIALTEVNLGIGKLLDLAAANGNLLLLGLSVATMVAFVFAFNILVWRNLYKIATRRTILEGTR